MMIRAMLGIALLGPLPLHAQLRNANWVFADGLWVSFLNDTMTLLEPAYVPTPRNACISDTAGQFMLLVDDTGIRNATFELVPGGSATELGWSGTPAANYLVLPDPGDADGYYVLINEAPPSGRAGYVRVDLGANGGAGQAQDGTVWYMDQVTAKLNATLDATGTGYWVVQHADEGDAFHAYHLQSTGWNDLPVISHTGTALVPDTTLLAPDRWGHMRISTQGDLLAMIKRGLVGDTGRVEVFHFDPSAGTLAYRDGFGCKLYGWSDTLWHWQGFPTEYPHFLDLEFDTLGRSLFSMVWDTVPDLAYYRIGFHETYLHDTTMATALDSLTVASWVLGQPFSVGSPVAPDPHGRRMGWGLDGHFYMNLNHNQPDQDLVRFHNVLRSPNAGNSWAERTLPPNAPAALGLPLFCKRYHDSMPSVGMAERPRNTGPNIRVRPNPIVDSAVLEVPGHQGPLTVHWRDAMGRSVRIQATRQVGPTCTIDRQGLPAGIYVLEVWNDLRRLGTARVVCE